MKVLDFCFVIVTKVNWVQFTFRPTHGNNLESYSIIIQFSPLSLEYVKGNLGENSALSKY